MSKYESVKLKINKFMRKKFAKLRQTKLNNTDFTIISNNCWGGMIYESYNLEKKSPTVGLFFYSDDYLKFISNLKHYMEMELKFVEYDNSKNLEFLNKLKISRDIPIGVIDDIEIYFLHYKSQDDAYIKWNRRKKRINYNNIIYKFNDQNCCSLENVKEFIELPLKNKVFFTIRKDYLIGEECIYIPQIIGRDSIRASNEPFGNNRYFNMTKYLNHIKNKEVKL